MRSRATVSATNAGIVNLLGRSGNGFLCWFSGLSILLFSRAGEDQTAVSVTRYPDLFQIQGASISVKGKFGFCRGIDSRYRSQEMKAECPSELETMSV